jgi:excisionase family DNA binding protein
MTPQATARKDALSQEVKQSCGHHLVENDDSRKVLSVEEAGRVLGIGRAAAYVHAKAGHIPTIRLGNRMLVPKAALYAMLQAT